MQSPSGSTSVILEINPEDNYGRQISFDTSDIWELFERNKKRTLKKYQHLEAYYDNLGRRLENRIAAERSPERKISAEVNEMENLEVECRRLARELESEMKFLNINLEFLESIKKHSVGKQLFKKHLNKYGEEIGSLVDDNDDQKDEEKNGENEEKTDLEKLRERRERLEKQLKSTKVRRDIAFKYVGDIVKEPTIKVASVFPIYARYDEKIRGYYKDILERNER